MTLQWPVTVADRIDEVIAQNPDAIALKDGHGRVLTYAQMDQRVESIATALVERLSASSGHHKDQVVGVFQMPTADYICSLLAIHRVGAVYLPLGPAKQHGSAGTECQDRTACCHFDRQ